jgi:hypothetical protein
MSPHNNARFNGSNVNSKASYHSDQNELGLAMGRLIDRVNRGLFKYSGLHAFYNSRLFFRGLPVEKLSDFNKMYTIYTNKEQEITKK